MLRVKARNILKELRGRCRHEHTILHSEYDGSHCMDCDDHHPESRACLMCSTYEEAYLSEGFRILTTKPIGRYGGKYPKEMGKLLKCSLSKLLEVVKKTSYLV